MEMQSSSKRLFKREQTFSGEPRSLHSSKASELFEGDALTSYLMKDELLERYSHELLSQILSDCKSRGESIIAEAGEKAAAIVDEARAEAAVAVSEAQSIFEADVEMKVAEAKVTAQRESDAIRKSAR